MTTVWLILAILCETGWALAMKRSAGLTRVGPTAVTIVLYLLSVVFLSLATKRMDIGVGYAIWAGSGAALIAVAGVILFREPLTAVKVISLGLIVTGIIGLHLGTAPGAAPR